MTKFGHSDLHQDLARRIGWMSRAGERLGSDLVCRITGGRYEEVGFDLWSFVAADGLRDRLGLFGCPACDFEEDWRRG